MKAWMIAAAVLSAMVSTAATATTWTFELTAGSFDTNGHNFYGPTQTFSGLFVFTINGQYDLDDVTFGVGVSNPLVPIPTSHVRATVTSASAGGILPLLLNSHLDLSMDGFGNLTAGSALFPANYRDLIPFAAPVSIAGTTYNGGLDSFLRDGETTIYSSGLSFSNIFASVTSQGPSFLAQNNGSATDPALPTDITRLIEFLTDAGGQNVYSFNAASGTALLKITRVPDPVVVTPDPVAVTPVPEPATWMMAFAGFGLVGAALRRRRVQVRFA